MTPVKEPHTRIKPLALASGHGRYRYTAATGTPKRARASIRKWPLHKTVINHKFFNAPLPKQQSTGNGCAICIRTWFKIPMAQDQLFAATAIQGGFLGPVGSKEANYWCVGGLVRHL